MLGKRKRDTVISRRSDSTRDESTAEAIPDNTAVTQDAFRKYFESTFAPLPQSQISTTSLTRDTAEDETTNEMEVESDEPSDGGSAWLGFSEDGSDTPTVEVIDYAQPSGTMHQDPLERVRKKSFMSAKPPKETRHTNTISQTSSTQPEEEDKAERMNLKHDLDLQRLLKESHLLEQSKSAAMPGVQRQKATDMRLQSLGSRTSLFAQEKMPMSHRKGITTKAASKEAMRRRDAKENGVILEKPKKNIKTSQSISRRARSVDVPAVGKFRGGVLTLSRRDVASIQGPSRGSKKGRR